EVGSALECGEVTHPIRVEQQAEPGEPQVARHLVTMQAAVTVIEHRRVVEDLLREAAIHGEHPHGLADHEAEMKEPHLEAQTLARPQRMLIAETYGLPMVPVEFLDG